MIHYLYKIDYKEWVIELLKKAIESKPEAKGYLIDGFPREVEIGPLFEKEVLHTSIMMNALKQVVKQQNNRYSHAILSWY